MTGTQEYNNNFEEMARKRIEKQNPIFKEHLNGFYDFMLSDISYSGAYGYLGNIINFLNYTNVKRLSDININTYTRYLTSIKTKTSSYRIMVYAALKKFSSYLVASEVCVDDYMKYIKRPKFKETNVTKAKRENGYLTEEEITVFINNIKNSNKDIQWKTRDLAMVYILFNTGIRCSALYKLDLKDVNLKEKTISVLEKGDNSREISITDNTVNTIKEWLYYRSMIMELKECPALFISSHKRRVCEQTIYNVIKEYGVVIKGKNITPHKTRSTYGTQLYNKTHDLYFVQQCMGHSNPKTTEIYIRGQKTEMSKKAANLMDDFLS